MAEVVDHKLIIELSEVVETLTTSGAATLDEKQMKKLKKICRYSDCYVRHCHHQLFIQLEKDHSEIRRSAFQICDELFQRSHCFRDMFLEDFQMFLQLTAGIDQAIHMPPPKAVAKQLKADVLQAVNRWHLKFGEAYKKLALGHKFLKCCKKVDFEDLEARSAAEQQREAARLTKQEEHRKEQLKNCITEMKEFTTDIDECISQAENCMMLLISSTDTFLLEDFSSEPSKSATIKDDVCAANDSSFTNTKGKASQGMNMKNNRNKSKCAKQTGTENDRNIIGDSKTYLQLNNEKIPSDGNQSETTFCIPLKQEEKDDRSISDSGKEQFDSHDHFVKPLPTGCAMKTKRRSSESFPNKCFSPIHNSEGDTAITDNLVSTEQCVSPQKRSRRSSTLTSEGSDLSTFEDDDSEDMHADSLRQHGVSSQLYSVNIQIASSEVHIQESADNRDILFALKDSKLLILNKFLPSIQRWLQTFSKCGGEQADVHKALDIKDRLHKIIEKVANVKVAWAPKKNLERVQSLDNDDDDDDDDFEEVATKEGYEPHIPDELRQEYGLVPPAPRPATSKEWSIKRQSLRKGKEKEEDTLSWGYHMNRLKAKEAECEVQEDPELGSSSQSPVISPYKRSLKAKAPVIPYGIDLSYWGEKTVKPMLVRYDSEHRFWTSKDNEDIVDKDAEASMKSRIINYVGEFEPVKWTCRAPLPSGELCPRRDRQKCPLHGPVIARNDVGMPVDMKDNPDSQQAQSWEDEELQRDIEGATGLVLTRKSKKSKSFKKNNVPGLSDVKKSSNPTRTRLEKKVLSRGALQRVSTAMDSLSNKRHKDKFGNNFNYTFTH